ncbi:glycosyltransferase family 2 protein [Thalassotalea euphylliae]|uniref:glycosyltransferase family 2 protein n=1 Tax=Thalassotalea euphylliae TaxID=1655234 RepID=UPI00362622C1
MGADMDMPTVSIIVPTYNRQDFLVPAIESLVNQTSSPLEIIVVDDGSHYNVEALLASYQPLVRVIRKDNGGKPAAVNLGLECAQGEYIWVFDDDDVAELDYLEHCVKALAKDQVDYIFGWHYQADSLVDGSLKITGQRRPHFSNDQQIFVRLLEGCSIAHNAIIARKTCYDTLGGIDTTYPCSEDYEFELRLAQKFRGSFIDIPSFSRRIHDGERGSANFNYQAAQRREKFLSQDRRFIEYYLENLPLETFIYDVASDASEPLKMRMAYLNKLLIAANVGAWLTWSDTWKQLIASNLLEYKHLSIDELKKLDLMLGYQDATVMRDASTIIKTVIFSLKSAGTSGKPVVKQLKKALAKNAYQHVKKSNYVLAYSHLKLVMLG